MGDTEENIPTIVTFLITSIKKRNGFETEGIFRLSARATEVDQTKEKFEDGTFDLPGNTAHLPAVLLKDWLRSLKEPVIPMDFYEKCVDTTTPEEAYEAVKEIPPVNLRVLKYIIRFLKDLGKPENAEKTRMGYENLALIFSASLLKSSETDPLKMLQMTGNEAKYIERLLDGMPVED